MELEEVIGYALRIGVLTSTLLILAGLVLIVVKPPAPHILEQLSTPHSPINTSSIPPAQVFTGVAELNGIDVILLGLMVLITTPVLRVAISIVQFIKERNLIYTLITVVVLFNLLLTIFIIPTLIK
ncbi:MAG: DUF1634 domain-containing protein [Pyrobaculum sp.]|nr:DUF1634 domain-containing protein [Pyrobaculum sp.]